MTGKNHKFWPSKDNGYYKSYYELFRCVDPSQLTVQGNPNSGQGQMLHIDLVKCAENSGIQCKSDEEVKSFFAQSYMMLLSN